MKRKHRTQSPKPVQFKIDATQCNLRIGDAVTPDTVVGTDVETGETVSAGCRGEVIGINFSGGEHALIVTIQPIPRRLTSSDGSRS
jgi:hypothetical protein